MLSLSENLQMPCINTALNTCDVFSVNDKSAPFDPCLIRAHIVSIVCANLLLSAKLCILNNLVISILSKNQD